ncbi:tryptophan synthase subunit alpha [Francisellaceae bacterium]|nr:tryptophan synthase subunit alpha [Francisellaceae bacterium]
MNRFQKLFQTKKNNIFIPFFTLGDPNRAASMGIIKAAIEAGADAIELGFPFSDPIADGPTNQRSMERALASGVNFAICVEMVAEIRSCFPDLPIGLLLYYNLLFRAGEAGYKKLAQAGVDGIVSADLPFEEAYAHQALLDKYDIGSVQMVAPNTALPRAKMLFDRSSAFTYVLSGFGTTGVKKTVHPQTLSRVKALREATAKPMVVGFGISKPEHARMVWDAGSEGVIVGSYFTSLIEDNLNDLGKAKEAIVDFVKEVKKMKGVSV